MKIQIQSPEIKHERGVIPRLLRGRGRQGYLQLQALHKGKSEQGLNPSQTEEGGRESRAHTAPSTPRAHSPLLCCVLGKEDSYPCRGTG